MNKEQRRAYQKSYHLEHKDLPRVRIAKREQKKEYTASLKREIHRLLGGKCVKCGYVGLALQIDHVNGGGCRERKTWFGSVRVSPARYYRRVIDKLKLGSQDYQLLCANHNVEKALSKILRGDSVKQESLQPSKSVSLIS